MKFLFTLVRVIYCLYALVLFILLMFIIIPFVVAASFFGKVRGGNLIYRICSFWSDAWCFFIGIRHKNIYDARHDKNRQYIFVANHISYLDAPILVKTIRQPVRVLGKAEMSQIPFFGFIYKKAIVTVERNNPVNRASSVRILKSVLKKNISVFMFPEGTFNISRQPLKDYFDGAFRIAIETQTPVKPLLFLDTYNRMHYKSIFSLTPGRSRSIFLEEISVSGMTLKDVQSLKQNVYEIMGAKLVEYRAGWINN
jgi:1-acyl-sn-glycerol-3-phosphate acyltransferase